MIYDRCDCYPMGVSIRWKRDDGTWWREVREPGANLSDLPPAAQATITAWWTPERVAAWQAVQAQST